MQLNLKQLKPNPFRVFAVDPIDQSVVDALTDSIKEDGFWGGVVCRVNGSGAVEIAAGHHRVQAAIAAGIKTADLFVGDIDDESMIRIYARENATQRGNTSTAGAGSVAAAIQYLAKAEFLTEQMFSQDSHGGNRTGMVGREVIAEFLKDVPGVTLRSVQDQLANLKKSGAYATIIREVQEVVDAQLRADQERIAKEARAEEKRRKEAEAEAAKQAAESARQAEIARVRAEKAHAAAAKAQEASKAAERRAAQAAADKAEADRVAAEVRAKEQSKRAASEAKIREERRAELEAEAAALTDRRQKALDAVDKADAQEITFDFAGVAKHFKNENQVRAFRDIVTSVGVQPYLPVSNQASVAQSLVAEATRVAKEKGKGATPESVLSAQFIRDTIWGTLHGFKTTVKRAEKQTSKAEIERMGRTARMKDLQHQFARSVGTMDRLGVEISNLHRTWPKSETFPVGDEFRTAVSRLTSLTQLLKQAKIV